MTDESQVMDVIAGLAADDTTGFRASYVARYAGLPLDDVQRELAGLVERGDLEVDYELLCPDNGRLIARYSATDPPPLGETIHRDDCEEFDVTPNLLWVTYRPSRKLLTSLLKQANLGKAQARRQGTLRRAIERLGIGSTRTRISST